MLKQDEPWKHYATWNKPVTKDDILYGSIYTKDPEKANVWSESTNKLVLPRGWGLLIEGMESDLLCTRFLFRVMKMF